MFPNEEETNKIRLETISDYPPHLIKLLDKLVDACEINPYSKRALFASLISDVFRAGIRRGNELAVRLFSGEGD